MANKQELQQALASCTNNRDYVRIEDLLLEAEVQGQKGALLTGIGHSCVLLQHVEDENPYAMEYYKIVPQPALTGGSI
jgi:hypothetical protein